MLPHFRNPRKRMTTSISTTVRYAYNIEDNKKATYYIWPQTRLFTGSLNATRISGLRAYNEPTKPTRL